ncbi:nucleotidyltransferase family protein [Craurococcus roseus]|uniref:Nucleotidyltransferase family protein n=1 Tax=Craurococcus roseus TaxID=77585 RepID=A0ABP3Q957_9PROT
MPPPPAPAIRDAAGLAAFLGAAPALRDSLAAVAALALPDAWIGAGFVRNALWDAVHGLPFGTNPPGDVDVVWFDPARASAEEDAALEARLRAIRPGVPWSVRNQARMAERNGDPPYAGTLDAVARWPDTATAVAARLDASTGAVEVAAPWGANDLLAGIVRPTPACATNSAKREAFDRRIAEKDWLRRWPGLRVIDGPPPGRAA